MTEDKTKNSKVTDIDTTADSASEPAKIVIEKNSTKIEKEVKGINDILAVKKDDLGLEELPEEIKKKLEKKQAENKQKAKTKKGKIIKKKKKEKRKITVGRAYVSATYNNTIVTITDEVGNVLSWASAGIAGFKGPKKATPYAAQIITRLAVGKAREEYGLSEVSVFVKGVGTGRESAVRALNNNGLLINTITDVTPIPHNGCRVRKPRRM